MNKIDAAIGICLICWAFFMIVTGMYTIWKEAR